MESIVGVSHVHWGDARGFEDFRVKTAHSEQPPQKAVRSMRYALFNSAHRSYVDLTTIHHCARTHARERTSCRTSRPSELKFGPGRCWDYGGQSYLIQ
eukprot:555883-Amphidinium_carterae.1